MRLQDLTGKRFGRLIVMSRGETDQNGNIQWNCTCDCGGRATPYGAALRCGQTLSCGCLRRERITTHGKSGTSIYHIWQGMRNRCLNQTDPTYPGYGGRGITVCDRWQSFDNFYADMGDRPKGMSLDRIDNDKGYSPENCRWATQRQQSQNTRANINLTFRGRTQCVSEWSRELGVGTQFLYDRITRNWSVEDMLTLPPTPRGHKPPLTT